MRFIDVFNGDADGICALVQLRLAEPREAELVTGIKRDINLLKHVDAAAGDKLTVLDISMEKNTADLIRLLDAGVEVFYADHHQPGDIPEYPNLSAHIDMAATTCTSLIIDKYLKGQFHQWAITAAYGDNLTAVADKLAGEAGMTNTQREELASLGIYLNYNGYGAKTDDLLFHPAELFKQCVAYASPFDFIHENRAAYEKLSNGYNEDMRSGLTIEPKYKTEKLAVICLPDEKWARRVSGVLGNELANQFPDRAHAIVSVKDADHYLVSLRAPNSNRSGADEVAGQFPTGGGRKAAAGINALPINQLEQLIDVMEKQYA
ncbi:MULTISPECIES: DHH family phosphoesterase [unclassified Methylophaga]|uniref:DHH family phosphoesterase n=1 Tax=unclassified Methylophaga TaxID=2629249 RepID=UPI000C8CBB27|nr:MULTISPECIES: DHH family phosphoesterase [unclassified Methylophaga]MBN45495.1 acetyltransferase [Methylophaga sp.]|tara:strand:- start:176719 stop:177678 length:960 start_codon:yes stop_codon:yes gene_type:complete